MSERTVKMRVLLKRYINPENGVLIGRDGEFMATEREAFEMEQSGQAERMEETASVKAPKAADPSPLSTPAVEAKSTADAPPASIKESGKPKKAAKKK